MNIEISVVMPLYNEEQCLKVNEGQIVAYLT